MSERIIIIGAGHAAGQAVAAFKQRKFAGKIVLVGEEPYLPYQRPPLSKKFLAGDMPPERLYFKPPGFYEDPNIDVRLKTRVTEINPDRHRVSTSAGDIIVYDKLILATGSSARRLPVDGVDLAGVHYLRSIDDVNRIRAEIDRAQRVVIVGAGYIGLEVAAVIRQLGLDVTVLEMADHVMSRVVSPQVSAFYETEHIAHGVKLMLSTGLAAFRGNDRVGCVETTDGQTVAADLVIIGVGIVPNTELASAAGLNVDDGIVVDDRCRTSDPDIYAIGDCTSHPNRIYDRRVRLESVHNALEQAKTAAANITGDDVRYTQVPWFWSDQYDLKLQIAGLSSGYDQVLLRGDPSHRSFACLYLKDGRLLAVDGINSPHDFMQSKALIANRATPDPRRLVDTGVALKDLA